MSNVERSIADNLRICSIHVGIFSIPSIKSLFRFNLFLFFLQGLADDGGRNSKLPVPHFNLNWQAFLSPTSEPNGRNRKADRVGTSHDKHFMLPVISQASVCCHEDPRDPPTVTLTRDLGETEKSHSKIILICLVSFCILGFIRTAAEAAATTSSSSSSYFRPLTDPEKGKQNFIWRHFVRWRRISWVQQSIRSFPTVWFIFYFFNNSVCTALSNRPPSPKNPILEYFWFWLNEPEIINNELSFRFPLLLISVLLVIVHSVLSSLFHSVLLSIIKCKRGGKI